MDRHQFWDWLSFEVVGSSPEQILGFYGAELAKAGWKPGTRAGEVGDGVWRGGWARDGQTLQVSASPYHDDRTVSSQLDLVLTG